MMLKQVASSRFGIFAFQWSSWPCKTSSDLPVKELGEVTPRNPSYVESIYALQLWSTERKTPWLKIGISSTSAILNHFIAASSLSCIRSVWGTSLNLYQDHQLYSLSWTGYHSARWWTVTYHSLEYICIAIRFIAAKLVTWSTDDKSLPWSPESADKEKVTSAKCQACKQNLAVIIGLLDMHQSLF